MEESTSDPPLAIVSYFSTIYTNDVVVNKKVCWIPCPHQSWVLNIGQNKLSKRLKHFAATSSDVCNEYMSKAFLLH